MNGHAIELLPHMRRAYLNNGYSVPVAVAFEDVRMNMLAINNKSLLDLAEQNKGDPKKLAKVFEQSFCALTNFKVWGGGRPNLVKSPLSALIDDGSNIVCEISLWVGLSLGFRLCSCREPHGQFALRSRHDATALATDCLVRRRSNQSLCVLPPDLTLSRKAQSYLSVICSWASTKRAFGCSEIDSIRFVAGQVGPPAMLLLLHRGWRGAILSCSLSLSWSKNRATNKNRATKSCQEKSTAGVASDRTFFHLYQTGASGVSRAAGG